MYFDAHNHFHDARLEALDREGVLEEMRGRGLQRMVVNGTCPEDWRSVRSWAERQPEVIVPSFGVHPWKVREVKDDWEERLRTALDEVEGPVGIGEIGLDRWIANADVEKQREVFRRQLGLAAEKELPVTIHCLRAWGLLLEELRGSARPERGFLIHSVGAAPEMIRQLGQLGGIFSVSGPFADPAKKKYQRALEAIPDDRLLIETDAPDMLGPEAYREREANDPSSGDAICHPADLFGVYRYVAEFRGVEESALREQVRANFERFFLKR